MIPTEPCLEKGWHPGELLGRSWGTSQVIGKTREEPRPISRSSSDLLLPHPKSEVCSTVCM